MIKVHELPNIIICEHCTLHIYSWGGGGGVQGWLPAAMLSEDGTGWLKGLAQLHLPLTRGTASPAIDTWHRFTCH